MAPASFVWRKFEWEHNGRPYRFEVARNGGQARLVWPGGRPLDLPMAAWAALSDAVRQAHVQERRSGMPARAGKSWSEAEHNAMIRAFQNGKTVPVIARDLDRTEGAVITRLAAVGLIDRDSFRPNSHVASDLPQSRDGARPRH